MKKPSASFFNTLGQYVYQYIDPVTKKPYYTGKGNADRCWSHVLNKEFDPKHCYITAKNLERFLNKKDGNSFLLESFLIATQQPEKNTVSGHYKECFEMASLSSMFEAHENEQFDNFENFPEWYLKNYAILRNRIREVKINSSGFTILSNAHSQMYFSFAYYNQNEESIKVSFEFTTSVYSDESKYSSYKKNLASWLKSEGYKDMQPDGAGKNQKFIINVNTIDDVISLLNSFWS